MLDFIEMKAEGFIITGPSPTTNNQLSRKKHYRYKLPH